jgi:hypothetical protein
MSVKVRRRFDATPEAVRDAPKLTAASVRGLTNVDQLCDPWDVHLVRDTKSVWCDRDLPEPVVARSHASSTRKV